VTDGALRTTRIVFALALAMALIPLAAVGWRLAKKDDWLSAPRRMPFVKYDGSVLPADLSGPEECKPLDIHFKMLIDGTKVWIPCKSSRQEGALARMDLVSKRVDYRWPYPSWEVSWTEGLLPLPDGLLASVVRIKGGLGMAVAGPDGWLLRPQQVDTTAHELVLGLGWHQNTLEVAIGGIDTDQRPAWSARIVTLGGSGVKTRPFTGCGEKCSGIHAAHFSEGRWHFLVNQDYAPVVRDMTEDGASRPAKTGLTGFHQLDSTASGVTSTFIARYVLSPSGAIEPYPPKPPWLRGDQLLSSRYTRAGDRLSRLQAYEIDEKQFHLDPPVLYSLTLEKSTLKSGTPGTPTWEDETLGVRLFEVSTFDLVEKKPLRHVARTHECNDFRFAGALTRVGEEIVVFDPSGCYVTLDANLRRKDAWGVWDHLRMRGSMYTHWNERSHGIKLVYLFVAPFLVVGGFFARRKWPRATTALSILAALAAIWCSVSLWPLLR
jgi:hypothetical protein